MIMDTSIPLIPYALPFGGQSALMVTLKQNPVQALKDLESGEVSLEEINHQNSGKWTALMYVCRNSCKISNSAVLIQKLLDLGANVNLKMADDFTALILTCSSSNTDDKAAEILLKHPGIEVNHFTSSGYDTALTFACHNGFTKRVEMLMKHPKIDIKIKPNGGIDAFKTVISFCPKGSMPAILKLFCQHPQFDMATTMSFDTHAIKALSSYHQTKLLEIFSVSTLAKII